MSENVYCSGENTGCGHEDKPTFAECSDCLYMTTIKPKSEQDELRKEIERILVKIYEMAIHSEGHQAVRNDTLMWARYEILAKIKQHYEQKIEELKEEIVTLLEAKQKRLDGPELEDEALEQWTTRVNAIVDILKIEMDGGFLENTAKYKDSSDDIIYSCMRAIAVQIVALIPDIEEEREKVAGIIRGLLTPEETQRRVEEAKREERERILEEIGTYAFGEPQDIPQSGREPVIICLTVSDWQALKEEK